MHINKRYFADEHGNPKQVVILLEDYRKIEEMLALDLDDETVKQLREARKDWKSGNKDACVDLDAI
jgi:PHD/YefM family antitoxin component YafN of YafNO toxin-antitoxin module